MYSQFVGMYSFTKITEKILREEGTRIITYIFCSGSFFVSFSDYSKMSLKQIQEKPNPPLFFEWLQSDFEATLRKTVIYG